MAKAAGRGKKESATERRQRKALNHSAHQAALYIWAGFLGILAFVLLIVFFVASRPKNSAAVAETEAAATLLSGGEQ